MCWKACQRRACIRILFTKVALRPRTNERILRDLVHLMSSVYSALGSCFGQAVPGATALYLGLGALGAFALAWLACTWRSCSRSDAKLVALAYVGLFGAGRVGPAESPSFKSFKNFKIQNIFRNWT